MNKQFTINSRPLVSADEIKLEEILNGAESVRALFESAIQDGDLSSFEASRILVELTFTNNPNQNQALADFKSILSKHGIDTKKNESHPNSFWIPPSGDYIFENVLKTFQFPPSKDDYYQNEIQTQVSTPIMTLDPIYTKSGFDGVHALVKSNQLTFIGENHLVDDENSFAANMQEFKAEGVEFLPVEFEDSLQNDLDTYLQNGTPGKLAGQIQMFPDLFALMRAAHKAGIKVVCVDQPYAAQDQQKPEKRERYIANNIRNLNGKCLIWLGSDHCSIDNLFPNVRTILDNDGFSTAGIKLESRTGEIALETFGLDDPLIQSALNLFYTKTSPQEITGYSTEALKGIYFSTRSYDGSARFIPYDSAFDLVLFLPDRNANQSVFR